MSRRVMPRLSIAGLVSALLGVPAAQLSAALFGPAEDYTGYGALGVALAVLVAMLSLALLCALLALYRRERPIALPIAVSTVSGIALLGVLIHLPGW